MGPIRGPLGVWFPAIRTGTGTDVFTERVAAGLQARGIRSEIAWLPRRAEYAPWSVLPPEMPEWATVVHANSWLHPRLLPLSIPLVVTVHHAVHHPGADLFKTSAQRIYHRHWVATVERAMFWRAQVIVAVSAFAAQAIEPLTAGRPVRVVHNGVDTSLFHPAPSRERQPRARNGIFQLLYVGKWSRAKGVDLFPAMMESLGDGFELACAGSSVEPKMLLSNMRVLGHLDQDGVASAMRDADAFVFPSRVEGFGMVTVEAMASGLVPIVARGCAAAEIIGDGRSGVLCEGDPDIFADAIRKVAADEFGRARMAREARARVIEKFSVDRMIERYLEIYSELG